MRVLIVDDEALARKRLRRMLEEQSNINIVAEAENGDQAISAFEQHRPELVFMDIQMPGMNGLDAAKKLAGYEPAPALVFCTAYDEHALAAFDASAVDYLLKPVEKAKLQSALEKVRRLNRAQLAELGDSSTAEHHAEILVSTGQGVEKLPLDQILYLRAEQKYVVAVHPQGEALLRQSLSQLEQDWPGRFVRAHRNTLIAIQHLRGINRHGNGHYAVIEGVENGPQISRRHLQDVKAVLST